MNIIKLEELELKILTELDITDYCNLNDINPDNITELNLKYNNLTDISGIKLFKNLNTLYLNSNELTDISVLKYLIKLKELYLNNNKITNISVLKNLTNLINLDIENLELESDQIEYIKSLKNIKKIWCKNRFKDMNIINELNKNIKIIKGMKYV